VRAVRDIELPVSGTKAEVLAHSASPAGVSVTLSSNYELRKKRGLFFTFSSLPPSVIIRRCEGDPKETRRTAPRDARGGRGGRGHHLAAKFSRREISRKRRRRHGRLSRRHAPSPGPYVPRRTSTARAYRHDGAEERERARRSRGGEEGGRERVYGRVRYTGARTKKETSALSSTIAHGGHVAVSSARCDYVRLRLSVLLSLSLCLSHSLALPLPPILV